MSTSYSQNLCIFPYMAKETAEMIKNLEIGRVLSGFIIMARALIKEKQGKWFRGRCDRRDRERERFKDSTLLALRMEEGAMRQGITDDL